MKEMNALYEFTQKYAEKGTRFINGVEPLGSVQCQKPPTFYVGHHLDVHFRDEETSPERLRKLLRDTVQQESEMAVGCEKADSTRSIYYCTRGGLLPGLSPAPNEQA